jgi:ankyrin repeat protein
MPAAELFAAVQANDARALRAQLAQVKDKASLHAMREGYGHPLMAVAAQYGHADIVHVLAEAGLSVNVVDANGRRPLHHAAMFGHDGAMKELVTHGAELEAKDKQGMTALQCASVHDRALMRSHSDPVEPAAVQAMIALGAEVPKAPADWPKHLQTQGTSDLQALVNRAASHAGQAAAVGQHWKDVVASPKAPATNAASPGAAL